MQELPPNVIFDCSRIPPNTVMVHREDIHQTQEKSKSSTWLYCETHGKAFIDHQRIDKKQNEKINEGSISVYKLDTAPHVQHQLSERGSNECFHVDVSLCQISSSVRTARFQKVTFSTEAGFARLVPCPQYLNLSPKSHVAVNQARLEFNEAPWIKFWDFEEVCFLKWHC